MLAMTRNQVLKPIVWVACLIPLGKLIVGAIAGTLGANPVERITHRTGSATLILLLCSLAITPLRKWSGMFWLIQFRRLVGLFAFFYGSLHLLTYLWLDQSFSIRSIAHDVVKRPFITMGTLAWLLLFPLALTSTQNAIRSLGKNWVRLHRLVYSAAAAGTIHFYWLVKRDKQEPLLYIAVLTALLGWRVAVWVAKTQREQKAVGAN
jgi:methionine sulfoxide reductase heme-binding subunit